MKTKILALIGALGILSIEAKSQSISISIAGDSSLYQARELLVDAINDARNYRYDHRAFDIAASKLQSVRSDVEFRSRGRDAIDVVRTLDLMISKLHDPYAHPQDKALTTDNLGRRALDSLDRLIRNDHDSYDPPGYGQNLEVSLRMMDEVVNEVRNQNYFRAVGILDRIESILSQHNYDRDILAAQRLVQDLRYRINDPYLSHFDKLNLVRNAERDFYSCVRNSDAYRRGGGGYPPPRPYPPAPPAPPYPPRPPYPPPGPRPGPRPGPSVETIVCQSAGSRSHCSVGAPIRSVQITRILSGSCIQGHSWGFDRSSVWVSNGCSAYFNVYTDR